MNADRRLADVRRHVAALDVGAFLVNRSSNVRFVTGFDAVFDEEPASLAVVTQEHSLLFVDSRYHEAATAAAEGTPWRVHGPEKDVWESALRVVSEAGAATLGIESSIDHKRFLKVAKDFTGTVVALDDVVEEVRTVKEDREIERVAEAVAIGDAAFKFILDVIAPGVTEREVALELEVHMRRNGSEGVAFPPIVAGGPNSSKPHATPGAREFEPGDFVVLDFGARVGGYCSDMTRTVVLGPATDEQRTLYQTVLAANEAGLATLRAGRTGSQVDEAARSVIVAAGLGERFGHGLGHGVGLEVHEAPRLGPGSADVLAAGTVVTIEPGVYVPEFGGVRIEDLAVANEDGCVVLTHSAKDLIEL